MNNLSETYDEYAKKNEDLQCAITAIEENDVTSEKILYGYEHRKKLPDGNKLTSEMFEKLHLDYLKTLLLLMPALKLDAKQAFRVSEGGKILDLFEKAATERSRELMICAHARLVAFIDDQTTGKSDHIDEDKTEQAWKFCSDFVHAARIKIYIGYIKSDKTVTV